MVYIVNIKKALSSKDTIILEVILDGFILKYANPEI